MTRLLSTPLRAPLTTLALVLLATVVLAFYASEIQVDSSFENLLATNDPQRVYYEEATAQFGSDQGTQIGLFADDIFEPAFLSMLDGVTQKLEKVDGVDRVLSITNIKGVEPTDFGLRIGRLMRDLPQTREEAEPFKRTLLDSPLYAGNFLSRDARVASILVFFEKMSEPEFERRGIAKRVQSILEEAARGRPLAVTGLQTIKVQVAKLMKQDLLRFIPLSILLVIAVLGWQFRTVRGVLLPLASVLIALVWTLGAIVLSGGAINMGTLILPPLLLAIGIAYTIHLINRYYQELHHGRTRAEVVALTMQEVRLPLAVAALTTALGFASLVISPITAVRELGIYSVLAILAVLLLDLTFIPAALLLLPNLRQLPPPGEERYSRVAARVARLSRFAIDHRRAMLAGTAAVCLFCLWGANSMRVNTDYVDFFAPDSAIRRDHDRLAASLQSTHPVYVVVEGNGPGAVSRLENLKAIRELQTFIAAQAGVGTTMSLADFAHLAQQALNPDEDADLPATQADLSQLLLLMDVKDLKLVATSDFARANIVVKTTISGSTDLRQFIARIEAFAAERLPPGLRVRVTGIVTLLNRSADALTYGQFLSLMQLLAVLWLLLSLLFLSLRAGFLSLIPNVVPVVVLFGIMGWTGFPLDFSTSMIAVIALGISVDATIHYLTELNDQLHATGSQEQAIANVARRVGRPIVFTAGALAAGFFTISLSNFRPIQHFGLLASITMLVAMVAHVLLTPALVSLTRIITLWDLLYVKLGPQPHKDIPLFNGLRAFQARIVVLMARLASAGPGAHITRRGEVKAELYVLISGRVEVRRREGEDVLRILGRGDVIGEMGLIRDRPRSAEAIAIENTEYLVLDRIFLERIRRRYPRIAARLFFNLTRMLSDWLESTTEMLAREDDVPRSKSA